MELFDMIGEARDFIRKRSDIEPEAAVIIGTGLSGLAEEVEIRTEIPYPEIPYFPAPTTISP